MPKDKLDFREVLIQKKGIGKSFCFDQPVYICASVQSVLHLNIYHEKHCQRKKRPEGTILSQSNCFQGAKGYFRSQIMIVLFNEYDARQNQYGHMGCCLS